MRLDVADLLRPAVAVHAEGLVAARRRKAVEARLDDHEPRAAVGVLEAELDQRRGLGGVVDVRLHRVRVPAIREQRRGLVAVARTGLVLDPVYTGKAMHGLRSAIERGDVEKGARVLFVHTGGLPGLLAQGDAFAEEA